MHTKSTEKACARRSRSGIVEKGMAGAWAKDGEKGDEKLSGVRTLRSTVTVQAS